jgi:phosphoribosylformylglycinamidine synthase I
MSRKIGVVRFPGTNCDLDIWAAVEAVGFTPQWLWHQDTFDANAVDGIILPGGFSYGDYLRTGALAAKSSVMKSVAEAAGKGIPVLGICNGFQILCEAGLLPGVLVANVGRRFIDDWVELEVVGQSPKWPLTKEKTMRLPIAHGEGRYFAEEEVLKKIEDSGQVWLRYKNNPNGSWHDIAGLMNEKKNVVGLMPHPERAMVDWMGGVDGKAFFADMVNS